MADGNDQKRSLQPQGGFYGLHHSIQKPPVLGLLAVELGSLEPLDLREDGLGMGRGIPGQAEFRPAELLSCAVWPRKQAKLRIRHAPPVKALRIKHNREVPSCFDQPCAKFLNVVVV